MRAVICDTIQDASVWVANLVVDRINAFAPTPERPFVFGLPTGSTPLGVYRELIRQFKAGQISFKNVVTFNMDEYVSLPRDHPQSYHSFMWSNLFSQIDISPSSVHILNGNAPSLPTECTTYESLITTHGGIHLFLAGVGTDGHLAFNEPGSSLSSRTRPVTLAPATIAANSRFFPAAADVPRRALTVGVATVLDAKEILCLAFGGNKARAVQAAVEGPVTHMWTVSALQQHENAIILADDAATLDLKVGTVRYFTGVEADLEADKVAAARIASLQAELAHLSTTPAHSNASSAPILTPLTTSTATPIIIDSSSPVTYSPTPLAPMSAAHLAAGSLTAIPRTPSPDIELVLDCMSSRIPEMATTPRAKTPELVPDRMASRLPEPAAFLGRMTPNPETQARRVGGVGAEDNLEKRGTSISSRLTNLW